jgi:hypothetical protein
MIRWRIQVAFSMTETYRYRFLHQDQIKGGSHDTASVFCADMWVVVCMGLASLG